MHAPEAAVSSGYMIDPGIPIVQRSKEEATCMKGVCMRSTMDVEDVKFVINFDYPSSSEDYVHRIGRTARSNNTGTAYTFFTNSNQKQASDLIQVLQEANQVINPKLRNLAETSYGGPGGRNRYHAGGSLGARRNNGMFGRSFGGKSFNNSSQGTRGSERYYSGGGKGYSGKGSSYNSSSYNNNASYNNSSNFNNKAGYKGNKSHDHSQSNGFPMNGNTNSGQFSSFGGQQNSSQATQQPSSYTGFNY